MLIAVAIIAAGVGWLRYESQRGWTEAKLRRLVETEFNPDWTRASFESWARGHDFDAGWADDLYWYPGPNKNQVGEVRCAGLHASKGANLGLFRRPGSLTKQFYYDKQGKFITYRIIPGPYGD